MKQQGQRGFSLIEIMVVIVIMGMLLGVIGPKVIKHLDTAAEKSVRSQFEAFATALQTYKMSNYRYPNTEQGLEALVFMPDADPVPKNWTQSMPKLPKDPWGVEFKYESPGDGHPFNIYTLGADGVRGGEGQDTDLSYWDEDGAED